MPLPTTGPVSFSDINTELQRSSTATLSMGDSDLRSLFEDTVGDISISTGRGKSWITAGSSDYTIAGTYTWLSPARGWNTLQVRVWGAGGGGSAYHSRRWYPGSAGGNSSFNNSVYGNGGNPGYANIGNNFYGPTGAGGTATGGDTNVTGGTATNLTGASSYLGGGTSSGTGNFPGGGGAGQNTTVGGGSNGGGGGGYASKTYTGYSVIAKNTGYSVVVGAGGAAETTLGAFAGARGRVTINWS